MPTASRNDQAEGLRQMFANACTRFVPVVSNPHIAFGGVMLERLCTAFAERGARVLVVDAGRACRRGRRDGDGRARPVRRAALAAGRLPGGARPADPLRRRARLDARLPRARRRGRAGLRRRPRPRRAPRSCAGCSRTAGRGRGSTSTRSTRRARSSSPTTGRQSVTHAYASMKLLAQRAGLVVCRPAARRRAAFAARRAHRRQAGRLRRQLLRRRAARLGPHRSGRRRHATRRAPTCAASSPPDSRTRSRSGRLRTPFRATLAGSVAP